MQVPPSVLGQIETIIGVPSYALPNYPSAYSITLASLSSLYPDAAGADADTLWWINVAIQVNSGSLSKLAVAIRASNAAASELLNNTIVNLFSVEEKLSSNAVANAFFTFFVKNDGEIPSFPDIIAFDAGAGLAALKLPSSVWAGAVPNLVANLFGFTTDNVYSSLTTAQQIQSNLVHIISVPLAVDELVGQSLGLSQSVIDTIIATNLEINTSGPFLSAAKALASSVVVDQFLLRIYTDFLGFPSNVNLELPTYENDLQDFLGENAGVTDTTAILDAGPGVNLDLSNPSSPQFDIIQEGSLETVIGVASNNTFYIGGGSLVPTVIWGGGGTSTYDFSTSDDVTILYMQNPTAQSVAGLNIGQIESQYGYYGTVIINPSPDDRIVFEGSLFPSTSYQYIYSDTDGNSKFYGYPSGDYGYQGEQIYYNAYSGGFFDAVGYVSAEPYVPIGILFYNFISGDFGITLSGDGPYSTYSDGSPSDSFPAAPLDFFPTTKRPTFRPTGCRNTRQRRDRVRTTILRSIPAKARSTLPNPIQIRQIQTRLPSRLVFYRAKSMFRRTALEMSI